MKKTNEALIVEPKKKNASVFYCKISGLCAVVFVMLIYISVCIATLCAPLSIATTYDKMGLSSLAYNARDIACRNSDDIKEVHFMFSESVSQKDYENQMFYYKKLVNMQEFDNYMAQVDTRNYGLNMQKDILTQISYANENNFLRGAYIDALYSKNRVNEAIAFAEKNLKDLNEGNTFNKSTVFLLPKLSKAFNSKEYVLSNDVLTILLSTYNKCKNIEKKYSDEQDGIVVASRKFEKKVMKARLSEMAGLLYQNLESIDYKNDYEQYLAYILK